MKRYYYLNELINRMNNGLAKTVTGSNFKFLSSDIITEFRDQCDEILNIFKTFI